MSKLTNWLDDSDSIDIQEIVSKYEKELNSNKQQTKILNNDLEQEIWSGSIEENYSQKEPVKTQEEPKQKEVSNQHNEFKTIKFDVQETINLNDNDKEVVKEQTKPTNTFETIKFNVVEEKNQPSEPVKNQESFSFNITKPLNQTTEAPSFKKPAPPPPPPILKKPEVVEAAPKLEPIKSFEPEIKSENDIVINDIEEVKTIKFDNINTAILDTSDTKKDTNTTKKNTVRFKSTAELKQQELKEKIQQNKEELFNLKSDQIEINDCKTVRFQPSFDEYVAINKKQESNEQTFKTSMFSNETRNIVINETIKVNDLDLTKEIKNEDVIKVNTIEQKKSKVSHFSKISEKKEKLKKLPKFIRFENKYLIFTAFLSLFFTLASFGLLGYVLHLILNCSYSIYLTVPTGLFCLANVIYLFVNIYKHRYLHRELRMSNYDIQKENPLISLKKIYKKLIVSNINLNWFSMLVYTMSGLTILLTFIVAYFMNLINYGINDFGNLVLNNYDASPLIVVWTLAGICFALMPIQLIYNIFNKRRMNNMDMFYQKEVISDELAMKYKAQTRKKWKIIYFTIVFVFGIIILVVWLILRKKTKNSK